MFVASIAIVWAILLLTSGSDPDSILRVDPRRVGLQVDAGAGCPIPREDLYQLAAEQMRRAGLIIDTDVGTSLSIRCQSAAWCPNGANRKNLPPGVTTRCSEVEGQIDIDVGYLLAALPEGVVRLADSISHVPSADSDDIISELKAAIDHALHQYLEQNDLPTRHSNR